MAEKTEKPTASSANRKQSDYFKRPHPFRTLKLYLSFGAAGIAALLLVSQAAAGYWGLYNPGKVANPHSFIEDNCASCHKGAEGAVFRRSVTDGACEVCHKGPIHHTNQIFAGHAGTQPPCASCHEEHRGRTARPSLVRDNKCTQCHSSRINSLIAGVSWAGITSFDGDHPEFKVVAERRKDTAAIKLNHKKHLRPNLPGPEGKPVQMQCADCHRAKKDGATMEATEFERDCQSCHALGIDLRIREQAPHEEPAIVDAFVRIAYSKYAGKNPNEWKEPADWHPARKLAELRQLVDQAPRNLPQWLESQVVAANRRVFEKKCQECHTVQNVEAPIPTVAKPEIPSLWLTHARFTHAPHRAQQCESCHKGVKESSQTADVLLPSRTDCVQCHNPSSAPSTCATCHTYHDKS